MSVANILLPGKDGLINVWSKFTRVSDIDGNVISAMVLPFVSSTKTRFDSTWISTISPQRGLYHKEGGRTASTITLHAIKELQQLNLKHNAKVTSVAVINIMGVREIEHYTSLISPTR